MSYDIFTRYEGNPILTADDLAHIPGGCNSVFNSTCVRFKGKYMGVLRVEERSGLQSIRLADSEDGISFTVRPDPILLPETDEQREYEEAIYDPRVTQIDDTYYIAYAAESVHGCAVALSSTKDFETFTRYGTISEPENRNLVLFPEKINGMYYRLDRPYQGRQGYIWIQESPDLIHWGRARAVMQSRRFFWDRGKIGPGCPPIKTDEGWLCIYHGVTPLCNNLEYRLGVALLDLNEPWKVLHRAKAYVLSPVEDYERMGDVPNVCFANGALTDFDKDELRLYYGGADQVWCLATCKISELIDFAKTK